MPEQRARAITVRPARILFLRNHNSESRYRIELHGDRWPDEFGRADDQLDKKGGLQDVFARLCTHANARVSNDNAFSRRCSRRRSLVRSLFVGNACVFACVHVHVYTGSFFLRVALLLHGTSGHVPPVTTPVPLRFTLSPSHPL